MGTNKVIKLSLNINIEVMKSLKLDINSYAVAAYINSRMTDPTSQILGWCHYSKEEIAKDLSLSTRTLYRILKDLHSKGLIEKLDKTQFIRTTLKWYDNTNGSHTAILAEVLPNSTQEKESNKEKEYINIPVLSEQDDVTPVRGQSCPLNHNSHPLKDRYPRGHVECVEYVNSFKFVNKAKQFRFLHQMLRSGLDFTDIDKLVTRIEKKSYFQENGYDFATVAGEADRRSNASSN